MVFRFHKSIFIRAELTPKSFLPVQITGRVYNRPFFFLRAELTLAPRPESERLSMRSGVNRLRWKRFRVRTVTVDRHAFRLPRSGIIDLRTTSHFDKFTSVVTGRPLSRTDHGERNIHRTVFRCSAVLATTSADVRLRSSRICIPIAVRRTHKQIKPRDYSKSTQQYGPAANERFQKWKSRS